MAIQVINTGTSANSGNGDTLRAAFNKVNSNFNELYNLIGSVDKIEDIVGSWIENSITTGLSISYNESSNTATFALTGATTQTIGGVIIGDNLSINNGVISGLSPYVLPVASTTVLGGVRSSNTVLVDENARIFVPPATTSTLGVVSVNTGLSVNDGALSLDLSGINQHLLPDLNLAYDLGSTSSQWRSLYLGTSTLYLGGTAVSVNNGLLTVDGQPSNPFDQNLNISNSVHFNSLQLTTGIITVNTGSNFDLYVSSDGNTVHSINLNTDGVLNISGKTRFNSDVHGGTNNRLYLSGNDDISSPSISIPNHINGTSTFLLIENQLGGGVSIATNSKNWNFNDQGQLSVPGNIVGYQPLMGYERVVLQPSSDVQENFLFYVDQTAGTFNRAGMELPTAYADKAVALAFPHDNVSVGYIFNQGTDTIVGTELNNALNIMMNSGDVKITALSAGPTYTSWTFKQNGNLELPNGAEIRDVNGDLRLRAAAGEVTQLQGIDPSGFVDSAVKAFYNTGSYVTINTNIDAGSPEHIWTFDHNGELTFPDGTVQATAYQFVTPPTSSTSTGVVGALAQDASYFYVCTATNAWQRIAWDTNSW